MKNRILMVLTAITTAMIVILSYWLISNNYPLSVIRLANSLTDTQGYTLVAIVAAAGGGLIWSLITDIRNIKNTKED